MSEIDFIYNPGVLLIISYLGSYLFKAKLRKVFTIIAPMMSMILLLMHMQNNTDHWLVVMLLISLWAGLIFAYDKVSSSTMQLALLYFGSGIAIALTTNLFIIFILLELMLVAATFIIFNGRGASIAGFNYFKFHILSGVLFLIATLLYFVHYGSFYIGMGSFDDLPILRLIMLLSLLINVAIPPFSYWLVYGYTAASPTGTAFLSVGVTKISLLLMMKLFLGYKALIYCGVIMSLYGVIYAYLESDIRKIFNYGIICQLGLVVLAIGVGGDIGKKAASFMIIAEIIYVASGAISIASLIDTRQPRNKHIVVAMLIAFASIAALPLTPGYIGKSLLHSTLEVQSNVILKYCVMLLSIGISFAVAVKIPFLLLTGKHSNALYQREYKLLTMTSFSVLILSVTTLVLGIFPGLVIEHDFYFSLREYFYKTLMFMVIILIFILVHRRGIKNNLRNLWDVEWFYHVLLMHLYTRSLHCIISVWNCIMIYAKVFWNDVLRLTSSGFIVLKRSLQFQYQLLLLILLILSGLFIL